MILTTIDSTSSYLKEKKEPKKYDLFISTKDLSNIYNNIFYPCMKNITVKGWCFNIFC